MVNAVAGLGAWRKGTDLGGQLLGGSPNASAGTALASDSTAESISDQVESPSAGGGGSDSSQ